MPINTNLNIAPYFDDFDVEKQFYKILFKPAYAVQARELTQLQTILQNQVEQFGDNIYQEGTIIKGCNFTNLNGLEFVKLTDKAEFDVSSFEPGPSTATVNGVLVEVDVVFEVSNAAGLKANIITTARGFETRPPDLNTFFINYLNTVGGVQQFANGEALVITKFVYNGSVLVPSLQEGGAGAGDEWTINVTLQSNPVGKAYGIRASAGVVFQKGHFLFTSDQTLVVSKYSDVPNDLSVGYDVTESLVNSLQDNSLYDNANGSNNENAPGSDRLKMVPTLVVKATELADVDPAFFTLIRYQNGSEVMLRDVTQFNSIAEELAKRTYEESGNYILDSFKVDMDRRGNDLTALVGKGTAYIKGYRVENVGKLDFTIDDIANTSIQQNQATSMDYGSYLDVVSINGTVDINFGTVDLRNSVNGKIGEAYVRNLTPTRIYLFGVKMTGASNFSEVVKVAGTGGDITVAANGKVKELNKGPVIFDTGTPYIKQFDDIIVPVRTLKQTQHATNVITITAAPGVEDFALDQSDILVVDDTNTVFPVQSVVKSLNNSVLTVTIGSGANAVVNIYYNRRLLDANPNAKVYVEPYVKVAYATANTKFSLGFPDVLKIISVSTGPGGVDYTDSFKLNTNQNDHYYDISYMEYIQGRPQPSNGQQLVVKLGAFSVNATDDYFFNINSYPIDDTTATLPSGKIRSHDLITYTSNQGQLLSLRNCFDFRPHVDKDVAVDYTDLSIGAAGLITNPVGGYNKTFSNSYLIPALGAAITSDVESYLARVDAITFDSYGQPQLIKGEEDANPVTPKVTQDQLIIAQIFIPGYPALSQKEASEQGKFSCAIQVTNHGTKNYTMRDIEKIERRIEGLEYYISLNQLEQSSENLLILDENGLSRFKNGYIVDPMNDSELADLNDPSFKAAFHFDKRILTPALNTFPLDLKYESSTGASIFPSILNAEVGTLSRNANTKLLGQPYATNFRNCVSNFWKYDGNCQISPSHDMAHDTVQNPVPAVIDIASVFQDLQEVWPQTGVNWNGPVVDGGSSSTRNGRTTTTTTPRSQAGVISNLTVNDGALDAVGDFVTNVAFRPFMRSRDIKVFVSGLRPGTQHYFFFDGVDVNAQVNPGTAADDARDVQSYGIKGAAVTTDDSGILRAIFTIPQGQFFVGDRLLTVVDVDSYGNIDSAATSKGQITYHAYNITQSKTTLSTRMPEFGVEETATSRNLAARVTSVTARGDPLAQTFFIKSGMGRGSNSVFISKVDLFFKRKSDINGATITLREVINGYPSSIILPFSKTHIKPTDVAISDDASSVTEVTFEAPVRMDVDKEYAIVVQPDANDPNYLIFTSKVGGNDLSAGSTQGQAVVMDWGDGVLFTSTNNRAWHSVQDEDIKFNLYRHDFNAATGTITLTNDDHEFFTLSDWNGRFTAGEFIYKQLPGANTVSMVSGTNVVTQSANDFTALYTAGDYILINAVSGVSDIFRIATVDSATQMTTDKPAAFNGANASGIPILAGTASHYNKYTASELHIKQSSATLAKKFVAADVVTGFTSGTEGTIGTVDNINLSYIQPLVQKANDSVTTTSITGIFTDPANVVSAYSMPLKFGDNNFFNQKGVVIYSKSNNFANPKPFRINVGMTNASNVTSTPVVDLEISTLLAYQFKVTDTPATTAKYISKTVELAEDLDAEDLNLYLTGYRPNGTDIKVYIRPQHAQDSSAADTVDWIELEMTEGTNTYSSSSNLSDYKEFRYQVAAANKSGGVLAYTSTSGVFVGYRKFAIRIDLIADSIHNAPFVKDYRGIALT
tara:strand:- start:4045 stop:9393 length:5349 start_codon:yes stop_codon:yes gene_type:complete